MTWRDEEVQRWKARLERVEAEAAMLRIRIADPAATPIDELELSNRALHCVTRPVWNGKENPPTREFQTAADFAKWSRADLLRLENLGPQTADHIERVLAAYGVALRK